jgi:hypothetical protein
MFFLKSSTHILWVKTSCSLWNGRGLQSLGNAVTTWAWNPWPRSRAMTLWYMSLGIVLFLRQWRQVRRNASVVPNLGQRDIETSCIEGHATCHRRAILLSASWTPRPLGSSATRTQGISRWKHHRFADTMDIIMYDGICDGHVCIYIYTYTSICMVLLRYMTLMELQSMYRQCFFWSNVWGHQRWRVDHVEPPVSSTVAGWTIPKQNRWKIPAMLDSWGQISPTDAWFKAPSPRRYPVTPWSSDAAVLSTQIRVYVQ